MGDPEDEGDITASGTLHKKQGVWAPYMHFSPRVQNQKDEFPELVWKPMRLTEEEQETKSGLLKSTCTDLLSPSPRAEVTDWKLSGALVTLQDHPSVPYRWHQTSALAPTDPALLPTISPLQQAHRVGKSRAIVLTGWFSLFCLSGSFCILLYYLIFC